MLVDGAAPAGAGHALHGGMRPLATKLRQALLAPTPPHLPDEDAAIAFFVRHRWPDGVIRCRRCRHRSERTGLHLRCKCRRRATIFVDTPLASLRKPSVLAVLLAIRAIAADKRGIAARALARTVGAAPATIWRHLHRIRALLAMAGGAVVEASRVVVCRPQPRAAVLAARTGDRFVIAAGPADDAAHSPLHLVAESVRTWLNGTHHGVTAQHLARYAAEAQARLLWPPEELATRLLDAVMPP